MARELGDPLKLPSAELEEEHHIASDQKHLTRQQPRVSPQTAHLWVSLPSLYPFGRALVPGLLEPTRKAR